MCSSFPVSFTLVPLPLSHLSFPISQQTWMNHIICNNNSEPKLESAARVWRVSLEMPLHPPAAGGLRMWTVPYLPNSNCRAMRECVRLGLHSATAGDGMHGDRGTARTWCVWEGKSWFLAHLCVTVPTWSQFPLPPYLFSQVISIIKNVTFSIYISINSTHLSICE